SVRVVMVAFVRGAGGVHNNNTFDETASNRNGDVSRNTLRVVFQKERRHSSGMNASQNHRLRRIVLLAFGGFIVETALALITFLGPGFAPLVRPGYVIVALIFFLAIWHAATGRSGQERRQVDP